MSVQSIEPAEQFVEGLLPRVIKVLTRTERHRIYVAGILFGAVLFVAGVVLGVIRYFTGPELYLDGAIAAIGLVLSFISTVAHVHLTSASGVVKAVESVAPKLTPIVGAVEKDAPVVEQAVKVAETVVPAVDPAAAPVVSEVAADVAKVETALAATDTSNGVPSLAHGTITVTPAAPAAPVAVVPAPQAAEVNQP